MTLHRVAPTSGMWPRLVLLLTAVLGYGWLTWPLWDSAGAADTTTLGVELPTVLAGLCGLLSLLALSLWLAAGRTLRPFLAAAPLAACAVITTSVLHPGASGVEFAYAFPLIAGVLMGAPAGFLTGATTAILSAVVGDTVATPLIGQALVWGLWGLTGGLFRSWSTRAAAAATVASCFPLAVLSGALLNLTGWPSETQTTAGAFLPGVGAWESLTRLASYTWSTSLGYDLSRGITTAVFLVLLGGPLIHLFRQAHDPRFLPVEVTMPSPPRIAARAVSRRDRSDSLTDLWRTTEGDPDE